MSVPPGIYVEPIDLLGKAIEVINIAGPAATAIDGNHSMQVARFTTNS